MIYPPKFTKSIALYFVTVSQSTGGWTLYCRAKPYARMNQLSLYVVGQKECMHTNCLVNTVKPVLSGHSKIDKTKVLKTNGSIMKVESIAKCSLGAFCNTFDLH